MGVDGVAKGQQRTQGRTGIGTPFINLLPWEALPPKAAPLL